MDRSEWRPVVVRSERRGLPEVVPEWIDAGPETGAPVETVLIAEPGRGLLVWLAFAGIGIPAALAFGVVADELSAAATIAVSVAFLAGLVLLAGASQRWLSGRRWTEAGLVSPPSAMVVALTVNSLVVWSHSVRSSEREHLVFCRTRTGMSARRRLGMGTFELRLPTGRALMFTVDAQYLDAVDRLIHELSSDTPT
ncbi:hypothetical protein [Aquihabitans sp. McL0605]|uniref:hypothetical protein n=1 Tax=Aquihabitans sp. McL0605 TaxID=3415671 RepID=UPI003CEC2D73